MGTLLWKPGTRWTPDPAGTRLLGSIERVTRLGLPDHTITSGSDGHAPLDPHTLGRAFDIRAHGSEFASDSDKVRFALDVLRDLEPGTPETLPIDDMLFAYRTKHWFVQLEYHMQPAEHLHFQLRRNTTFYVPPSGGNV